MGAGLATCLGAAISCLVMLTHFLSPRNTLRLVPVKGWIRQMGRIGVTGFSAFFADIAMGILTILFNRQIMHFLGTDALAVYGVLVNVSTLVQCCAYSVGQASQPILSLNYGARQTRRILDVLRYALGTVAVFGVLWVLVLAAFPTEIVRLSGADPGGPGGSPGHFADVWAVLLAAAVQYLFCLLFPVYSSAGQCLWNLCHPRPGGQRRSHSHLAGPLGRLGPFGWRCR